MAGVATPRRRIKSRVASSTTSSTSKTGRSCSISKSSSAPSSAGSPAAMPTDCGVMHCLWLTLADPEPRHNGQFVYSGGLIDALAAEVDVTVLGLARGPREDAD